MPFQLHRSWVIVGLLVASIAAVGLADRLILKNGDVYTGENISLNSGVYIFKYRNAAGLPIPKQFKQRDVVELIKEELPKDFWSAPTAPEPQGATSSSADNADSSTATVLTKTLSVSAAQMCEFKDYLDQCLDQCLQNWSQKAGKDLGSDAVDVEVVVRSEEKLIRFLCLPLHGTIGHEIQDTDIQESIEWAEKKRVKILVLHIDSKAGFFDEAKKIAEIIRQSELRGWSTVAVVQRAAGPAKSIAMACKHIVLEPGGPLGGKTSTPEPCAGSENFANKGAVSGNSSRWPKLARAGNTGVTAATASDYGLQSIPTRRVFKGTRARPTTGIELKAWRDALAESIDGECGVQIWQEFPNSGRYMTDRKRDWERWCASASQRPGKMSEIGRMEQTAHETELRMNCACYMQNAGDFDGERIKARGSWRAIHEMAEDLSRIEHQGEEYYKSRINSVGDLDSILSEASQKISSLKDLNFRNCDSSPRNCDGSSGRRSRTPSRPRSL